MFLNSHNCDSSGHRSVGPVARQSCYCPWWVTQKTTTSTTTILLPVRLRRRLLLLLLLSVFCRPGRLLCRRQLRPGHSIYPSRCLAGKSCTHEPRSLGWNPAFQSHATAYVGPEVTEDRSSHCPAGTTWKNDLGCDACPLGRFFGASACLRDSFSVASEACSAPHAINSAEAGGIDECQPCGLGSFSHSGRPSRRTDSGQVLSLLVCWLSAIA